MTDLDSQQSENLIEYINKRCNRCKQVKSVEDFHKNSQSNDGRRSICKECHNAGRRVVRDTGTIHKDDGEINILSPKSGINISQDPPGTVPGESGTAGTDVPGGFGTPLVLVLLDDNNDMMEKVDICPSCCRYNVLWIRRLIGHNISHPIGICSDCLLQFDSQLINFYERDGILYIVRAAQMADLTAFM